MVKGAQKPRAGSLHLTATHLLFIEETRKLSGVAEAKNETKNETWVRIAYTYIHIHIIYIYIYI